MSNKVMIYHSRSHIYRKKSINLKKVSSVWYSWYCTFEIVKRSDIILEFIWLTAIFTDDQKYTNQRLSPHNEVPKVVTIEET